MTVQHGKTFSYYFLFVRISFTKGGNDFHITFICKNFLRKGQVTRWYSDAWFVVRLHELFNIQWSGRLFETPWRSCDVHVIKCQQCIMASHYNDVMISAMASQITSLTIVYSTVYSSTDQRKHQSSASLAFERGIHRWTVNSPHKWPVTRKCFHLMTSSCTENPHGQKYHTISYHVISIKSNQLIVAYILLELELELEKCLLDKKQIQAGNNVINDTYWMFYVGRPLQRRWAHRRRKSHPNILQCMNRHRAHELGA